MIKQIPMKNEYEMGHPIVFERFIFYGKHPECLRDEQAGSGTKVFNYLSGEFTNYQSSNYNIF
jgi:hypothetical protein